MLSKRSYINLPRLQEMKKTDSFAFAGFRNAQQHKVVPQVLPVGH
jgi:hypothetical protein